jgi:hypothetical protein
MLHRRHRPAITAAAPGRVFYEAESIRSQWEVSFVSDIHSGYNQRLMSPAAQGAIGRLRCLFYVAMDEVSGRAGF